jgi:hypothetical protein
MLEAREALTPARRALMARAFARSARSRFRQGDSGEAEQLFARAAALDPDAVTAPFPHSAQRVAVRLFGPMLTERMARSMSRLAHLPKPFHLAAVDRPRKSP